MDIDRFAVGVVASDVDCTGAASWTDSIARDISISSDHVNIVSKGLEVVGDTISRDFTTIVKVRCFDVGFLWQMATETAWVPGAMASDAVHVLVAVGAFFFGGLSSPSHHAIGIHLHGLGDVATRVIRLACWVDRLGGLRDNPFEVFLNVATLDQYRLAARNAPNLKPRLTKGSSQSQQVRRLLT